MIDDLKERLLPCPFCGKCDLHVFDNCVVCGNPSCGGTGPDLGHCIGPKCRADAIAAWNTRTPDPRITDLEARLAAAEANVNRLREGEARLSLLLNETAQARDAAEAERDAAVERAAAREAWAAECLLENECLTAERDAALAQVARLQHLIREASDPDFLWGAMDNVNDMDADITEFANAASRAIRASIPILAAAEKDNA